MPEPSGRDEASLLHLTESLGLSSPRPGAAGPRASCPGAGGASLAAPRPTDGPRGLSMKLPQQRA